MADFAIPLIKRIHRDKSIKRATGIKCIVIVATRELAMQIGEVFTYLAKHTRVKPLALIGGVEEEKAPGSLRFV